jgi:HemY protein
MKLFTKTLVIFALALAVSGFGLFNNGAVAIYVASYKIELSLNLLILLWLLSVVVIYYAFRILINLKRIPNKIYRARVRNALVAARQRLNFAGLHYFEGKYRSCYDNALKSLKREANKDNKFLAYMLAYRAANIMRDQEKEDKIATELEQFSEPKWQLAKHLLIAENFYNHQLYGQAIDHLNAALQLDRSHVPAHRMLLKVYLHLANYSKAYEMLEWLLKNDSLREYKASKYKARVIGGLFAEITETKELNKYYNKLDKNEKSSFLYSKLYFNALLRIADYSAAVEFLERNFKDNSIQLIYSESLLELAKKVDDAKLLEKLTKLCEKAFGANAQNAELLLTLGVLNYQQRNLEQSRTYLESSLKIKPSLDATIYLSFVAEATHDNALLAECQKKLLYFERS